MDNLRRMIIFSHVVDAASFSGAARRLGIAKSAVSKHISQLENELSVRLLNQTTRSLSLTEIGKVYYESCARIVAEAEDATRKVQQLKDAPLGLLKISAPISFGSQFIVPMLNQFMKQHPSVTTELLLNDHVVDMVKDGIDIGIRIGWLTDSSLLARKLRESPRLICASPEYIKKMGLPQHPQQLLQHECIIFSLLPTPYRWVFDNGQQQTIHVRGRIKTNNAHALRAFILEGAGIGAISHFMVADDIKAGNLVQLLPSYDIGNAGIFGVYQDKRFQQAKVRMFLDFLSENLPEKL